MALNLARSDCDVGSGGSLPMLWSAGSGSAYDDVPSPAVPEFVLRWAGTGAVLNTPSERYPLPSGCNIRLVVPRHPQLTRVFSTPEVLAKIKSALTLNVSELARILNVKRPTIYSWIAGNSMPHSGNQERIDHVFKISSRWNELSDKPVGEWVRYSDEEGTSLVGLLGAVKLDYEAILKRLSFIATKRREESESHTMSSLASRYGLTRRTSPGPEYRLAMERRTSREAVDVEE